MADKYIIPINPELRKRALEGVNRYKGKLDKAVAIYRNLCENLVYSLGFYLDVGDYLEYFTNPDNLALVDGRSNNEVVCFTFNALCLELFYECDVIDKDTYINAKLPMFLSGGEHALSYRHRPLVVYIDGYEYSIDSTLGVLDRNDLAELKYTANLPKGWSTKNPVGLLKLTHSIHRVFYDVVKLNKDERIFSAKAPGITVLPLEERVNLFLTSVKGRGYNLQTFNFILKSYRKFFNENERWVNKQGKDQQFVDLYFMKNRVTREYLAYLMVNPKGYIDEYKRENFDSFTAYEISVTNQCINELDRKTFKEMIDEKVVVERDNLKVLPDNKHIRMAQKGRLHLVPKFDQVDGKTQLLGYNWISQNGETFVSKSEAEQMLGEK